MKKIFFLLLFCFLLVNAKAIDGLGGEDFDFTKKGNVYERTFRMPYDFWGSSVEFSICLNTKELMKTNIYGKKYIAQEKNEFLSKLSDLWDRDISFCEKEKDPQKCYERMEKLTQEKIKALEAYHPNQYFKFKITFIPLANPEEKQEKIVEFPLYFVKDPSKKEPPYRSPFVQNNRCLMLIHKSTKLWRKYYVKIEVLEDTTLPKEIIPKVKFFNPNTKH